MLKILVNGCNGKMGNIVCDLINQRDNMQVIAGFDKENISNSTFPIFTDINKINVKPDVIIDFSLPVATLNILEYAKTNNIPTVIATTGFSENEIEIINEISKTIPIFQSANMSFDIMIMKKLVSWLAPLMKDTDIEIKKYEKLSEDLNRKIEKIKKAFIDEIVEAEDFSKELSSLKQELEFANNKIKELKQIKENNDFKEDAKLFFNLKEIEKLKLKSEYVKKYNL